jgi:hypothetical protein
VHDIELFVFLLLAVAVLAGLGLRLEVPYPVALVLGGLVIGLMPGLPSPELDPDTRRGSSGSRRASTTSTRPAGRTCGLPGACSRR